MSPASCIIPLLRSSSKPKTCTQNEKTVINEIDLENSRRAMPILLSCIFGGSTVLLMSIIIGCLAIGGAQSPTWVYVYFFGVVCIGLCFVGLGIFFNRRFQKQLVEDLTNQCRSLIQRYPGLEVCCNVSGWGRVGLLIYLFHFPTRKRVPSSVKLCC